MPNGLRGAGLALCVLLVVGCSTRTGDSTVTNTSPDLIVREQILDMPDGTALDVIQRLRPNWLRPRSQGTIAGSTRNPSSGTVIGDAETAFVFVDEVRFGELGSLSRISSLNIESIVFISPLDATTRYGTGYTAGIIRVNTVAAN